MTRKINVKEIKNLIRESKLEEAYQSHFVENFRDVRGQQELDESEIDALAEELFKQIFEQ